MSMPWSRMHSAKASICSLHLGDLRSGSCSMSPTARSMIGWHVSSAVLELVWRAAAASPVGVS